MSPTPLAASSSAAGVAELWRREVGDLGTRPFAHRFAASESLVLRLEIQQKLNKHTGCVNTVSFNSAGDILASGSDDQTVILWDWDSGAIRLSFHSGHSNNVFQARFMPYSDDRVLVTCAADGEVRLAEIPDNGDVQTTLLGEHDGRVHKLAIEPGSPYMFYSAGEDGVVQHFDLRANFATKLFECKAISKNSCSTIHLNAISIDPRNTNFFAVGGRDAYAQVFDIRKCKWNGSTNEGNPINCYCPKHLVKGKRVAITGLAFSHQSELLTSYNNENIYLFSKEGLGPSSSDSIAASNSTDSSDAGDKSESRTNAFAGNVSSLVPRVYKGHVNCETIKGVSFIGPDCEYIASGSDCGRLFIWRKRDGKLLRAMDGDRYVVNCIERHPNYPVIASSGIENDVKIWTPSAMEVSTHVKLDELKPRHRSSKYWQVPLTEVMIRRLLLTLPHPSRSGGQELAETLPDVSEMMSYVLQVINGETSTNGTETPE